MLRDLEPETMRALQIVQSGFDQVPDAPLDNAVTVQRDYKVATGVTFVFADAAGGPLTITLPQTGTATITCRSISSSANAIKIQTADAAKINGTQPFVSLVGQLAISLRYNSTNKTWWTL